jgi:antitoxin FitA
MYRTDGKLRRLEMTAGDAIAQQRRQGSLPPVGSGPEAPSRRYRDIIERVAQIVIRQLDDDVKAKLQRRAREHGRSTEEEVREILRNAVRDQDRPPSRLGTRISSRFARIGLREDIAELRGEVRPADLEP